MANCFQFFQEQYAIHPKRAYSAFTVLGVAGVVLTEFGATSLAAKPLLTGGLFLGAGVLLLAAAAALSLYNPPKNVLGDGDNASRPHELPTEKEQSVRYVATGSLLVGGIIGLSIGKFALNPMSYAGLISFAMGVVMAMYSTCREGHFETSTVANSR